MSSTNRERARQWGEQECQHRVFYSDTQGTPYRQSKSECEECLTALLDEVDALRQLAEIRLQESMRQEMAKEQAEAEVTRLRSDYSNAHNWMQEALDAKAEAERLRAALKALLDYTEQVEQLAYDITEQIEIHPVVAAARAALRGGE